MSKLRFGSDGVVSDPTLVLMTKSGSRLGPLVGFENFHYKRYLNQADEISLTVHKYIDGERNPLWDRIVSLKVLWYRDANECFELDVDTTDDEDSVKQVTGTALAESELSQILLFDTEVNTENDIAREDYVAPTVFYNATDPSISLLDRVLNKAPHYHIAHVDGSLTTLQRTFSFDNKSIVQALNEIAEEIKCIFLYDSGLNMSGGHVVTLDDEEVVTKTGYYILAVADEKCARSISAYDLMRSCRDCGKRFEGDACPKCGSIDFNEGYGVSTGIVVSKDNLADNIDFESDTDSVKNCFRLVGGDDDFTALIRACNPNGTNYIWNITDDMKSDMTAQLVSGLDAYDALYQEYATTRKFNASTTAYNTIVDKYIGGKPDLKHIYSGNSSEATTHDIKLVGVSSLVDAEYTILDLSAYLQTSMMPTYTYSVPTAQEQCNAIRSNITTISVTNVNSASSETVALAIKSLAKIYAHTEIYNVSVTTSSYASQVWKGVVTLTNFSDDTDTASTSTMTVTVSSSATNYATELVQKKVNEYKNTAYDISSLFDMSLTNFKAAIKSYSLDCLKAFTECCQACISVLIDQGAGTSGATANTIYTSYYNRLKALESEITTRSNELTTVGTFDNRSGLLQTIMSLINNVHKALDLEAYLGADLWNELIVYRREQEYSNSNYRSDGLTNAEMIQYARGFYEAAETELYKASQLQHSISAPLKNLLAMPEFEGLTDNFEVGNWIYVIVDEKPYKLRLVSYEIGFDDIQNIDVEFSDLLAIKNGVSDLKSVIDSQKSVASSYGMVYKQAAKGELANKNLSDFYATGINGAKIHILSNETAQDIQIGDSGLLGRRWVEEEERYSLEQCRMTNSTLAFTSDGWATANAAIGKIVVNNTERYGIIGQYIIGEIGEFASVSADKITSGTLDAARIGANTITATMLSDAVNTSISTAQSTANGANSKEQLIYKSAASGTSSMAAPTSWVTATGDTQNAWTTKRPTYSSSYPVLFVATQRQTVSGTVTCTTPLKDDTTTVIDGGHITTGTIDASKATITNINASNITSGTINASTIGVTNISASNITTGTLNSDRINTTTLMAKSLTATGSFQVNNGVYKLAQTTGGFTLSSLSSGVNSTEITANTSSGITLKTAGSQPITISTNNLAAVTVNGTTFTRGGNITRSSYSVCFRTTKTVTGTTGSTGTISLGLANSTYGVVSVQRTDAASVCLPYITAAGAWYAHVIAYNGTGNVGSTSVTLQVDYYIRAFAEPNS